MTNAQTFPNLDIHNEAYQTAKQELGPQALIREVLYRAEVIRKELQEARDAALKSWDSEGDRR